MPDGTAGEIMRPGVVLPSDIGGRIRNTLLDYIKVESYSFSEGENEAEQFFCNYFTNLPYFKENPDFTGVYPLPEDNFDRCVCYAMVRGSGNETVVLLHHYDVVGIEDFKALRDLAFRPYELAEELKKISSTLAPEVQEDLAQNEYLFGRGACDMKGGGAIQMELLRHYSSLDDFPGTVIVLGLPDEENLSAGMRAATLLLDQLRYQYGLNYVLAVNSEPHQRKDPGRGLFSMGSVGKLMPFIYVRGSLAHAGKVFEGFNPSLLLSEIVSRTQSSMDFSDIVDGEASPPPTWLYMRDNKANYDVSMPLSAFGCLSVLTLKQTPGEVMNKVKEVCQMAFSTVLENLNNNYMRYLYSLHQPPAKLPWQIHISEFTAFVKEASANYGDSFTKAYKAYLQKLTVLIKREGPQSLIQYNIRLIEFIYDYIDDIEPRVIYGLLPPYYPHVSNYLIESLSPNIAQLPQTLAAFAEKQFSQPYDTEKYYTGISDLSYTSLGINSSDIQSALYNFMPGFNLWYGLPLDSVEKISMPSINIGPWGKDFHKLTERVNCRDLYEQTPALINKAVMIALGIS
ncbi:MAG: M20/M25/M40 family metallo-hydrolase [Lachnospiraceae bacterium]